MVQYIGYLASLLLGISLMMRNDLKFRWFNTLGCFVFTIYGIALNAFPVTLANGALFFINLYYLIKIYKTKEDFEIVTFSTRNQLIRKFLDYYKTDLALYFPKYQLNDANNISFFVLRDMAIANVFVADLDADGNAWVKINYTVPKYRDFQIGKYIFENDKKFLIERGVKRVVYGEVFKPSHLEFLKTLGFEETVVKGNSYIAKRIAEN